jgi:hypothetical protein
VPKPSDLTRVVIFVALAALLAFAGTPLWATIVISAAALVMASPFRRAK